MTFFSGEFCYFLVISSLYQEMEEYRKHWRKTNVDLLVFYNTIQPLLKEPEPVVLPSVSPFRMREVQDKTFSYLGNGR